MLEEQIKNKLALVMYDIARAEYDDMYSSANYEPEIRFLNHAASILVSLAKENNIDISTLKSTYLSCEVYAKDLIDFESYAKWF